MHKRKLHHLYVKLRPISIWYFFGLTCICLLIALFAMRQNNLRAIELREAVLTADKENKGVEEALNELREFTYSHMNARLSSDTGIYPPIQLKYTYDRLVAAERTRAEKSNKDVYADAQKSCEARFPAGLSGGNRIPCIEQYVKDHGGPQAQPKSVPDALYKFDFVSPVWSPDVAGWAWVATGVSALLLVTRIIAHAWLKHQLD